jgi:RecB family exonuclease
MKRHPVSPTSLKMFLQCPALYRARYIDKLFQPQSNRFLERGIRVHSLMEDEIAGKAPDWGAEVAVYRNVGPILDTVERCRDEGYQVLAELEAAVTDGGLKADWWGDDVLYRSKIDLLMVNRERGKRIIMDWKTGKTPGDPLIQLGFNAMCLFPELDRAVYDVFFVYVDQGRSEHFRVMGAFSDAVLLDERGDRTASLSPHLKAIAAAYDSEEFPATCNDKCRWCEWKGCGI